MVLDAAKEKRRQELRTELGSLTDRAMKSKPTKAEVKYRGPNGETWSGVCAMAGWLKKLKEAEEDRALSGLIVASWATPS